MGVVFFLLGATHASAEPRGDRLMNAVLDDSKWVGPRLGDAPILFANRFMDPTFPLSEKSITKAIGSLKTEKKGNVRISILFTLYGVTRSDVRTELLRLLKEDPAPGVREAALLMLGENGFPVEDIAAGLLAALKSDLDANVRVNAAVVLGGLRAAEAQSALIEARKKDPASLVRGAAAEALTLLEKPLPDYGALGAGKSYADLVDMLSSERMSTWERVWLTTRLEAMRILNFSAAEEKRTWNTLVRALEIESNSLVKMSIVHSMLMADYAPVTKALQSLALTDRSSLVRARAVYILGVAKQRALVDTLISILAHDASALVRASAAAGLGSILQNRAVVKSLAAALEKDKDSEVRVVAAEALGNVGSPEGVAALEKAGKNDKSQRVRERALSRYEKFRRRR